MESHTTHGHIRKRKADLDAAERKRKADEEAARRKALEDAERKRKADADEAERRRRAAEDAEVGLGLGVGSGLNQCHSGMVRVIRIRELSLEQGLPLYDATSRSQLAISFTL